jgi:hypothetical protein
MTRRLRVQPGQLWVSCEMPLALAALAGLAPGPGPPPVRADSRGAPQRRARPGPRMFWPGRPAPVEDGPPSPARRAGSLRRGC